MGPISITNIISLGLNLDQFRKLMLCFIAKKLISPSKIVEQSSDALYVRYKAFNGELYNDLFGQLPELAVDEQALFKGRLENTKAELFEDFPLPFVE